MYSNKIFRETENGYVQGKSFWVIINNFNYSLAQANVYADGIINCRGEMNLEEFKHKLKTGWIVLSVPDNSELYFGPSKISVNEFIPEKDNDDFIKEIENEILELSGQISNRMLCEEKFRQYLLNDSDENFNSLKITFENQPKHLRAIFEWNDKDALYNLMNGKIINYTKEQRKSILDDYFENKYLESDFK